jgi:hypothetical protein
MANSLDSQGNHQFTRLSEWEIHVGRLGLQNRTEDHKGIYYRDTHGRVTAQWLWDTTSGTIFK